MKKLLTSILLLFFIFSLITIFPDQAEGRKRKVIRKHKITRRYYRKRIYKSYFEYFLTPRVADGDAPVIAQNLRDRGVSSVKLNPSKNSLILKFKASEVTTLDIILALRGLGYEVSRIN